MNSAQPRYDYAIFSRFIDKQPHIALIPGEGSFTLPPTATESHFWQTCEPVNRAINETYGIRATSIRCIYVNYEPNVERETGIYAMEYHAGDIPGAQWYAIDQINGLNFEDPRIANTIREWFVWYAREHPLCVEWYQPGWFSRMASEYLPQKLTALGYNADAKIEQVRSWGRSSVLRAKTTRGDVYVKTVPQMFAHEPRLSSWLYQQYPAHFPAVIDIEGAQMLMPDYQGTPLISIKDITCWEGALSTYAQLQVKLVSRVDELLQLGCPTRSLGWLDAGIDPLLADTAALQSGVRPCSDEQIETLKSLAPRLHAACKTLASYHIPDSLEHGDLWTGQIIVHAGQFLFTDWSDCSITHPLFSLPFFVAEIDNELPGVTDARQRLRDAYLQP